MSYKILKLTSARTGFRWNKDGQTAAVYDDVAVVRHTTNGNKAGGIRSAVGNLTAGTDIRGV